MGVRMGFEKRLWTRVAIFGCDSFVGLFGCDLYVCFGFDCANVPESWRQHECFLTAYPNASFSDSTLVHQRRLHSYASAAALAPCWLWLRRLFDLVPVSPPSHLALLTWTPRIQPTVAPALGTIGFPEGSDAFPKASDLPAVHHVGLPSSGFLAAHHVGLPSSGYQVNPFATQSPDDFTAFRMTLITENPMTQHRILLDQLVPLLVREVACAETTDVPPRHRDEYPRFQLFFFPLAEELTHGHVLHRKVLQTGRAPT